MDNQEAIRLIRNLPTMCEFTDAYGEPIDSDAYYEAVDIAISALQGQDLQSTCNELAKDTNVLAKDLISKQDANLITQINYNLNISERINQLSAYSHLEQTFGLTVGYFA